MLSILFWVSEFPDVWQILNKRSLWFGVSGSDQSHHHQTLRERWWNPAWLCGENADSQAWASRTSAEGLLSQIRKEDTLVLTLCRCLPHAWVFDFMQFGLHYPHHGYWNYERHENLVSTFKRHFLNNTREEGKIPDHCALQSWSFSAGGDCREPIYQPRNPLPHFTKWGNKGKQV